METVSPGDLLDILSVLALDDIAITPTKTRAGGTEQRLPECPSAWQLVLHNETTESEDGGLCPAQRGSRQQRPSQL